MHSVVFRDYGNGLVEWGYCFRDGSGGARSGSPDQVDPEQSARSNAQRARTAIRRTIMARKCDYMVTLTYRENMGDRARALRDLRAWTREVGKAVPGFVWVAVPERQSRGAWHWHIAVKGWQNVVLLRSIWRGIVGDGNIDVRAPKRGGRPRWGRLKLAYYLVKYISKDFYNEVPKGSRRYHRDRKVVEPETWKLKFDTGVDLRYWIESIISASKLRITQEFADAFGGWGATWASPYGIPRKPGEW